MLHVFSTNQIKLVARTPMATDIPGRREYRIKSRVVRFVYNNKVEPL
jgi:hypothetical protein